MNTKEILEAEFVQAAERKDFQDMADIYEEMERVGSYDDSEYIFGYSYSRAWMKKKETVKYDIELTEDKLPRQYCFAEIIPGNRIKLPEKALNYIGHFGDEYIYCLENEDIKFSAIDEELGEECNNLIYEFYEEEGVDTKTVEITDTIYLDDLAMHTLDFRVGDIVKIWLENGMFIVSEIQSYSKYVNCF